MSEVKEGPQIKHIDLATGKFKANGNQYYIQSELSLERYVAYLKMTTELSFNTDFDGMNQTLNKIFKAVSSGNDILDAIRVTRELAYNQINAIADFSSREVPSILRFCTLFINTDDEDIARFDDRIVDQKIENWTEEGYAIDDFFFLAANFIPSFRGAFQSQHNEQGDKKKHQKSHHIDSIIKDSKSSSPGEMDP